MLVDKQSKLMSDLLFTVQQHGSDDVTWKPPINNYLYDYNKRVRMSEMWRECALTVFQASKVHFFWAKIFTQAPVVKTWDSANHRINHYPADKYWGN